MMMMMSTSRFKAVNSSAQSCTVRS